MPKVTTPADEGQGKSGVLLESGVLPEAAEGSLGTLAKLGHPPPNETRIIARFERFQLQSIVRTWMPGERIGNCLRARQALVSTVKVMKGNESCFYGGLQTCGSIYHCPVCASKIAEHRRGEVARAIAAWEEMGGQVLLVTYTVSHWRHERLKTILTGMKQARRLHRHRKPYKGLMKRIGLVGIITAFEVTYGENGFHPHPHELLFIAPGNEIDLLRIKAELLAQWQDACEASGLRRPNLHGVTVQDGSEASKYVTKWGLDCELTKGHIKKGREGSLSMWDLIRLGKSELFLEYAKAFKGKKQLVWSKGLRALLGLRPSETDEAIAAQVEEDAELLGLLAPYDWKLVLQADRRAQLLQAAETGGWPAVKRFITEIVRDLPCPF